MARSGVTDIVSVSVEPGPVKMHPLTFELDSTIDDLDKRSPEGADYLFVPAVENFNDVRLVQWVRAQSNTGGTQSAFATALWSSPRLAGEGENL